MSTSSLNAILIAANSGLRASQVGLDVVSRNVANASTPGYTRKTVPLENRVVGGEGQGVFTGEIQRSVNVGLMREVRRGMSIGEALRAKEDFLGRLELAFGAPGDETSISSQVAKLGDAFRALSAQPDSATSQQTVLSRADGLARSANALSDTIQNLRLEADQTIGTAVDGINTMLGQIDELNRQIVQATGLQQTTADLEDKRDGLLDKLSKELDINYFQRDNGEVWILTGAGRFLLDSSPHTLSFNGVSAINPSMTYAGGTLAGVQLDGVDITTELNGGRLKGLLDVRDDVMADAQTQLDELTARIAQNFALSDLDLFDYASTETVVTGRTATALATAGSTTFTVSSAAGLGLGMQLRFANHSTTYTVTGIAGTTITLTPAAGTGTGLSVDVPAATAVIFADPPGVASVGYSKVMDVNPTVEAQPWRLRDGTSAAAPGTIANDNTIPRAIIDMFEEAQAFTASAGLGASLTIGGYANALISFQSGLRASAKDSLGAQDALNTQLQNRFASDSGVNVDAELALMIEIQNAYAASAKVINATREMFDELLKLGT
jgi:flagellar hook-associated protein 1